MLQSQGLRHRIFLIETKLLEFVPWLCLINFACIIICCWLTAESVAIYFEDVNIPKWILWILSFGLLCMMISSFYLFFGAFNVNHYVEYRLRNFILGLLVFFLLGFCFFLPTNAHALFYKQMAKNTAVKELEHVDGELQKLSSENTFLETYNTEWNEYERSVLSMLHDLKNSILDYQNPCPAVDCTLSDVELVLGVAPGTITPIKPNNRSIEELRRIYSYYDNAVKQQLELKKRILYEDVIPPKYANFQEKMKNVPVLRRDIKATLDQLQDDQYDKEAVLKNARKVIGRSYAELESQFNGIYTYNESVYRSDRLVKVTKVWGDYFKGKFRNTDYTLWYWILLSILLEMMAITIYMPKKIYDYVWNKWYTTY